jgi:hypothetical protein
MPPRQMRAMRMFLRTGSVAVPSPLFPTFSDHLLYWTTFVDDMRELSVD